MRTDHRALIWLFSLKEPKSRIARWIEILSDYNLTIEYRPWHSHWNADAMSRCDNPRDSSCQESEKTAPLICGPCHKCAKRNLESSSPEKQVKKRATRAVSTDHLIVRENPRTITSRFGEDESAYEFSQWRSTYTLSALKLSKTKLMIWRSLWSGCRPTTDQLIKKFLKRIWMSYFISTTICHIDILDRRKPYRKHKRTFIGSRWEKALQYRVQRVC